MSAAIRIRLQTLTPLPLSKYWMCIRETDSDTCTISQLSKVIHSQLHLHQNQMAAASIELSIDGFKLLGDSLTFCVLRDNDLVSVGISEYAQNFDSTHFTKNQSLSNGKRKLDSEPFFQAFQSTLQNDDDEDSYFAKEDQFEQLLSQALDRKLKKFKVDIPADDEVEEDIPQMTSDADESSSAASSDSEGSSSAEESSSSEDTESSSSSSEEELSDNDNDESSLETHCDVTSTATATSNAINSVCIPSGLTKNKRKAVQNMIDTERTHVRFDDANDVTFPYASTFDEPPVKQNTELSENEPYIVYSHVHLKDSDMSVPSLSKSARRRMRRNQRAAQLAIGGAVSEELNDNNDSEEGVSLHQSKSQDVNSNTEQSTIEPNVTENVSIESNKDSQASSFQNYDLMPYLQGLPRPGMVIAFKTLELSTAYTPEISEFKEAQVLSVDAISKRCSVKLLSCSSKSAAPLPSDPSSMWGHATKTDQKSRDSGSGRFEINDDDSEEGAIEAVDGIIHVDLDTMFEIKRVAP
ncbi:hypothetical protein QVD99_004083 [Batrachochytrium dendrobatidis]|nr:hypothetical protein QVD99_004083 [Batrachochytrium dendrobatidis]